MTDNEALGFLLTEMGYICQPESLLLLTGKQESFLQGVTTGCGLVRAPTYADAKKLADKLHGARGIEV